MTPDSRWIHLNNPFESVTKDRYKLMNVMVKDHHDKLFAASNADAALAPLYNMLFPAYKAYRDHYAVMIANDGIYKGHTQIVETLRDELSGIKIEDWDIAIQNVYRQGSPEYTMILPERRKPFQSKGYESRIREIRALSIRLDDFPLLAAVKADVDAFLIQFEPARTKQQGFEGKSKDNSLTLERLRVDLAQTMLTVFLNLRLMHIGSPGDVMKYYEEKYLRSQIKEEDLPEEKQEVQAIQQEETDIKTAEN